MTRLEILDDLICKVNKYLDRELAKGSTTDSRAVIGLTEQLNDLLNEHREEAKYIDSKKTSYVSPYTFPWATYTFPWATYTTGLSTNTFTVTDGTSTIITGDMSHD